MKNMRWAPGIIGGLLAAIMLTILLALAFNAPAWILLVGWVAFGYWFARSGPMAWPRTWLVLAIESFALPLATFIMSGRITAETMATTTTEAEQAGAALGSAVGTTFATGAAGFLGFFLGIIFALLAYFTHRNAKSA